MNVINELQLNSLSEFAKANHIPVVCEQTATFLYETVKVLAPKNILEVGTAIGYSGIIMLKANNKATLTTIELDFNRSELAKQNFANFEVYDRVKLINDDAKIVLENLKASYDFIFLDGPKGQYLNYLLFLLKLLNAGGTIFCDNINLHNLVSCENVPKKKRTMVNNLRKFKQEISSNKSLNTTFYEVGDGVAIIKKLN